MKGVENPDLSRPAWSLPAPSGDTSAPEVAAERFGEGVDLGLGGMGRVRLLRDRWLGRDIALKEPVTVADAARLWHEALVTSRLEHPGIVAIYDVGFDTKGVPWFAMRVVRGRSLAEYLSVPAAGPAESPRSASLLRPLLAACEAVGFAHSRGVVHRDLKPSNLMLGAFGEMQVIDWGLARAEDLPDQDLATAGTPAYMSPEQARGEVALPTSDVWSLGAVIYEVVTERSARPGTADEVRTLASTAATPLIPEDVPPPLAAILRRAMAPRPEDRYPDGKALAQDLERYLDGRRVDAHTYTPLELLMRLVRAWRVPLMVLGAALVALTVLVVIGVSRIGTERDQAQANLSLTLVREAQRMLKDLRVAEAELLAATALSQTDDSRVRAEARGVLAALGPERPRWVPVVTLPCAPVDVAGDLSLCREPGLIRVFDDHGLRFEIPVDHHHARFVGQGAGVVAIGVLVQTFDVTQGELKSEHPNPCANVHGMRLERTSPHELAVMSPHCAALVTVNALDPIELMPCRERVSLLALTRLDDRHLLGACDDGALALLEEFEGRWSRRLLEAGLGTASRPPVVTAMAGLDADSALVGFGDGGLERISLKRNATELEVTRAPLASQRGLVRSIVPFDHTTHALVLADASGPLVVDLVRDRALLRLPRPQATAAADGDGTLVLAGRNADRGYLERWDLSGLLPSFEPSPRGVTTVAARRDVPMVALGDGPTLVILDGARRRIAEHTWQAAIIRVTTFVPRGDLVAHGLGRPELRRFSGATELEPYQAPATILRRLTALADGSLLGSAHIQQQFRVRLDRPAENYASVPLVDLATSPDGRDVVQLLEGGAVQLGLDYPQHGTFATFVQNSRAMAVRIVERRLFALEPDGVSSWFVDVDQPERPRIGPRYLAEPAADLVSIDVTKDHLAAGARDGAIWIWRLRPDDGGDASPGAEVEVDTLVRAHEGRVDSLAFGAGQWRDGGPLAEVLVSGGWDRVARWFTPTPTVNRPEDVEATWGIALADIFRAR